MKKTTIIISLLFTWFLYGLQAKETPDVRASVEIKTIDYRMLPDNPVKVEIYSTPTRNITIEISNTTPEWAEIYYYSPLMENKNYSYRKFQGNDNNFLGLVRFGESEVVTIPDTIEHGDKLLIHAVGYELVELPMKDIANKKHIRIQFTPRSYYSSAVLYEKIYDNKISIIEIDNIHEIPKRVFYGECLPIWNDDGNHADPYCAGACMGCFPEFNFYKDIYPDNQKELSQLYRALKKGENCGLLITVDEKKVKEVKIIGFSNSIIEAERKRLLGQRMSDGYRFQYRLNFEVR
ncbi:hypothetical protein [Coprobacter tertius]|uniref:Uncharacterized protein n=1 Tax=Coprobacter tertius TaxID=2944915 RepID=A0ABT1MGC2_9BACT|nr:hypothetical protein [Coprobacter tertius]MCP9611688.1 hypothetical protein [Coprobacter tertius]